MPESGLPEGNRDHGAVRPPLVIGVLGIALALIAVLLVFFDDASPDGPRHGSDGTAKALSGAPEVVALDAGSESAAERSASATDEIASAAEETLAAPLPVEATGLTGRIIGRDGKPRAGVTVTATRNVPKNEAAKFGVSVEPGEHTARYEKTAETDANGVFTVVELIPAAGYSMSARTVDGQLARKGPAEVLEHLVEDVGDIALLAGALVSGTVRRDAGGPVAGAEVSIGWWSQDPFVTDDSGRFDAGVVIPGRHRVWVKANGLALAESIEQEFVEGDVIDDFELVLVPAAPITGRVCDDRGQPIAEANIYANREEQSGGLGGWYGDQVVTGADGRFAFQSIAAGEYGLGFNAEGFIGASREGVIAGGPPLEVTLERAASIRGAVVDARTGAGVKPDRLSLSWIPPWNRDDPNAEFEDFWNDPQSDIADDGTFSLTVEESGHFKVSATADGYARGASDAFDLDEHGSVSGIVVRLEPGTSLAVTVLDGETSQPVKGAIVELFPAEAGSSSHIVLGNMAELGYMTFDDGNATARRAGRAVTDGDGKAQIRSLKDGEFQLTARKKGHAPGKVEDISVAGGQPPSPVEVRLTKGGAIEGRVVSTLGEPEPAMKIAAFDKDGGAFDGVSLEGGHYRIENLAAGRYRVEARPEGGMYVANSDRRSRRDGREIPEAERLPIVVEEGSTASFDVTVERLVPGSLSGVVLLNGSPLPGMQVMASYREPSQSGQFQFNWNNRVTTDDLGNFEFRRLRPGKYALSVHEGWRKGFSGGEVEVAARSNNKITISITLGGITGLVMDGDGNLLAGANVSASIDRSRNTAWTPFGDHASAQSAGDGSFVIEELQNGPYNVTARCRGYKTASEAVSVAPHRLAGPVQFRLQPGGWLQVRVAGILLDEDRGNFVFEYKGLDGQRKWRRWAKPEEDGTVWLENPAEERGMLEVRAVFWDGSGTEMSGAVEVSPVPGKVTEVAVTVQ